MASCLRQTLLSSPPTNSCSDHPIFLISKMPPQLHGSNAYPLFYGIRALVHVVLAITQMLLEYLAQPSRIKTISSVVLLALHFVIKDAGKLIYGIYHRRRDVAEEIAEEAVENSITEFAGAQIGDEISAELANN